MFHKKYLILLDLPLTSRRDNSDSGIQPASSVNYGSLEHDSSTEDEGKTRSHKKHIHINDLKNVNIKEVKLFLTKHLANSIGLPTFSVSLVGCSFRLLTVP